MPSATLTGATFSGPLIGHTTTQCTVILTRHQSTRARHDVCALSAIPVGDRDAEYLLAEHDAVQYPYNLLETLPERAEAPDWEICSRADGCP